MIKKAIAKFIFYFVIFALLALTERALGLAGFCVAFLFALVYCREKVYLSVPTFVGAVLLVEFSLVTGITVAAAAVPAVVISIIHYKKRLKYRLLETMLFTLLAMIPTMAFTQNDPFSIAITALSVFISVIFHYLSIIGVYPMLVRGIRYRLNPNEKFAIGVIVCVTCCGLGVFRPFNVEIFYFVFALSLMICRGIERKALVILGVCMGLGAAVGYADTSVVAYSAVCSLVCYATSKMRSPVSAAAIALVFCAATYFFNGNLNLWSAVPLAVGCLLGAVIPQKLFKKLLSVRQGYQERFALRTVVNRDREELALKLRNVSEAFNEMQTLLINERPDDENPESIVRYVCETACVNCPHLTRCVGSIGDVAQSVRQLVIAALDNGKATILDAGLGLGENCTKLSHLLNLTNDSVRNYRKMQERKSGIEQGKEMVIVQLGGVAQLLNSLARSVSVNLSFDTEPEKKLIEKLGQANVIATDVCFYTDGNDKETSLVVRESDVDKPCIAEIVAETVGCPMTEFSRSKDVAGMASLHFCRAPIYKVLYGETASAKENRCGDTRQAVKIGFNKLMFILSDGMGTGAQAHFTAGHVIRLIETFYKAGFDHRTVFSNVSRLLALRDKEDFSALDVAIIDTQTGDIDFIKQGGRESYIFTDKECEIINGGTLPIGIIADSEPVIERRKLKPNDLVIMMSDGVADAFNAGEITELIRKTPCLNPQNATDALINDAIRLTGDRKDDMTAIALRLIRNTN